MNYREMRRKEKEMGKDEVYYYLENAPVGRLGTVDEYNRPLVTPMHFLYYNNKIILHSSLEGQKINNIINNKSVCFEIDEFFEVIESKEPCNYTRRYSSIVFHGKAVFIEDYEEKEKYLSMLFRKYNNSYYVEMNSRRVENTAVIEIELEHISGKKN